VGGEGTHEPKRRPPSFVSAFLTGSPAERASSTRYVASLMRMRADAELTPVGGTLRRS